MYEVPLEVLCFRANMISIRQALRISQSALARSVGMKPQNICDIEAGRRSGVTLKTAARIAEALGVPLSLMVSKRKNLEDLLEGDGQKKKVPRKSA